MINRLSSDSRLVWIEDVERLGYDRESIYTKTIKEYEGILFCFYDYKIEILFKPHYFFNDNLHNANDFTVSDCIETIVCFIQFFRIDASRAKVINIEFGINFLPPISIEDLIVYATYHGKNKFREHSGLKYSKISSYVNSKGKSSKYKSIKFYAKGLQFREYAHKDLARFEIKSNESKYINRLGVFILSDLLNKEGYNLMGKTILEEFDLLLILFPEYIPNLTSKERNRVNLCLNPNIWYGFTQQSRNQYNKKRKDYDSLISKKPDNLKNSLIEILKQKIEILKTGAYSTPPINM